MRPRAGERRCYIKDRGRPRRSLQLAAGSLACLLSGGRRTLTATGLARAVVASPVLIGDTVYTYGYGNETPQPFSDRLQRLDKNKDGKLSPDEYGSDPVLNSIARYEGQPRRHRDRRRVGCVRKRKVFGSELPDCLAYREWPAHAKLAGVTTRISTMSSLRRWPTGTSCTSCGMAVFSHARRRHRSGDQGGANRRSLGRLLLVAGCRRGLRSGWRAKKERCRCSERAANGRCWRLTILARVAMRLPPLPRASSICELKKHCMPSPRLRASKGTCRLYFAGSNTIMKKPILFVSWRLSS